MGVRLSDTNFLPPSSVMSCWSILVKVPMMSPAVSFKGWLVGLRHRTVTSPLAPGWLMLLASTTWSLKLSINPSGAWLWDVRWQESATSGGPSDRLHTAHHQPSKPVSTHQLTLSNSDDRSSEIILQSCLAKNGMPRMTSSFIRLTTKIYSNFTSLTRIGICTVS